MMPTTDEHTGLVHEGPGHVARGYSWPPFEPGHWKSLKHGAQSPRKIRPIAEALEAELVNEATWTDRSAFRSARASWAWVEAQLLLLRVWIDEHGELDATSERAVVLAEKLEGRAAKLRDGLGLTPAALGKLLAQLASVQAAGGDSQGLAAVQAEGQAIVAARERQLEAGEGGP